MDELIIADIDRRLSRLEEQVTVAEGRLAALLRSAELAVQILEQLQRDLIGLENRLSRLHRDGRDRAAV